jgi:plasmid stability protein
MPTLVIKDVPVELHRRLKEEAQKAHRSMNGEAIYLLESGLNNTQSISAVHELPAPYQGKKPLTDKLIQQWKRQGLA